MTEQPSRSDIHLVSGDFWGRDPQEELTWMRHHAPVYWDENSGLWGISKHRDVQYISKRPDPFSSAQGMRPDADAMPMMIDTDDPQHVARRKLVSQGFTPRRVATQEDRIREISDAILDNVCERGECDFVWDIAARLPLIVIADALGFDPEDWDRLLGWSDDMLRGLVGIADDERLVLATEAFEGYSAYISEVIERRRAEPRDDLVGVLVRAEVDGDSLDRDSLIYESLLLLIGGDETTRHVISGGAYQLFNHPEQYRKLVQDPAKIPVAVEEMLRWVSPIKNMARTVTRDVEVGGRLLREGDKLLLLYPSANRDEDVFEDPFRFDIERSPNDHLAFGVGSHFCMGNSLARLELRVMFEQLLQRIPDLALSGTEEPERRPANFVSGYESMPVTFTPQPKREPAVR
ncbi:cytochrome P450 [Saccharopolyspora sp. HNM0983]|uniref:Cytochrome P450 n=1 Tax=Saccharopolyspora montiporae TaxID=2781240 RepID=A0A929B7U8_9PSEU|nr:cytochrome P450 [Saccharopolyspora sp. HNM0983]MBE9373800.1 cytochrome P450 [Saccharopolyspora sp. HNM0983]